MDFPDFLSTAWATGLALGGLGLLATLLLFLLPSPAGSIAGRPLGYTTGTSTMVELPEECEIRVSSNGGSSATCPGATWSVDGREGSGTLYGRPDQLSQRETGNQVEARVFNGSAYLRPSAAQYGATAAALALVAIGLLAAVLTIPLWTARFLSSAWDGDWDVDDVMAFGVVGIALAAAAGAAAGYLAAEDSTDRLTAGAVVAAAAIGAVVKVRRWHSGP